MQAKNEGFNQIFPEKYYDFLIQKNQCLESNLKENLVFSFQYTDESHQKLTYQNTHSSF